MTAPKKHRVHAEGTTFNYLLFDHLGAFNDFVDLETRGLDNHHAGVFKKVNAGALINLQTGSDWYGKPVPQSVDELDRHDRFLGMGLLKQLKPLVEKHLSAYLRYLDVEVMPKPKISYNDRGLGIFSFERAAMALYRNGHIALGTPIEKTAAQITVELGRDAVKTRVKKVYAFFENKDKSYPSIRLYLMAGANAGVQGQNMLYVGLSCAELVEFLEQRGVAVEVNVLLGSAFSNQVCLACIRAKRFQDKIDKNLLLLLSSDPRYFRYRGFKALIALSNYFGLKIPESLGRLEEDMGKLFVSALDSRKAGKSRFVFEQSYSLEQAAREVKRVIETYRRCLSG